MEYKCDTFELTTVLQCIGCSCLRQQTTFKINTVAKFWRQQQKKQQFCCWHNVSRKRCRACRSKVFYLPIGASGCKLNSHDINLDPSASTATTLGVYFYVRMEDSVKGWPVSVTMEANSTSHNFLSGLQYQESKLTHILFAISELININISVR